MKRIYRSTREKILGGVAAGMADYLDLDVALVRLLWVLFAFMGGIGLPVYIVAWIIIPEEPYPGAARATRTRTRVHPETAVERAGSESSSRADSTSSQGDPGDNTGSDGETAGSDSGGSWDSTGPGGTGSDGGDFYEAGSFEQEGAGMTDPLPDGHSRDRTNQAFGILLVVFGVAFLFKETFHLNIFRYVWPVLLILLGAYILINDKRGS